MKSLVQIVLVETSHPGNIGSVARAMKNMGLSNLALINPKKFPHQEAIALAGNAVDILKKAKTFTSIESAVQNSKVIYATSARERAIDWPTVTAIDAADEIHELVTNKIEVSISDEINISIYQGPDKAEGTRANNQTWVNTVRLTGQDIPKLLPKGSEVNLFLEVVRDGVYNLSVDVPYLNDTIEKTFEKHEQQGEDDN